jgi:hypothetical protein
MTGPGSRHPAAAATVGRHPPAAGSVLQPGGREIVNAAGVVTAPLKIGEPDQRSRRCSRCHVDRKLSDFRLDSRGYPRSHCRACALEATAAWRLAHRDELLAVRRARYRAARARGLSSAEAGRLR